MSVTGSQETVKGVTWTERFNCHSAKLAGGAVTMQVDWNSTAPKGSPSGFVVKVQGRTLKQLFVSLDEGKAAAVRLARKIASEVLAETEGATK